jgi:ABC-2 type transport system ATP-binding protein
MIIEAHGVHRYYGGKAFHAVRGVDFSVARGELVAVLGVNGAGKTSFIELLEGMAQPSSGTIRVFGCDPVAQRYRVRPLTGIMLQEAGFAGELTVKETLVMWARTLSRPRPVTEALDMVMLTDRAAVKVKALSGGERRRLDLSMALLGQPELLFLDEPTTGLDPASRRTTWDLVHSMMDGGTTVVLTTHYLEEAEALADRIVIMARGQIARSGTIPEIVAGQSASITFGAEVAASIPGLSKLPALVQAPKRRGSTLELRSSDLQPTLHALLDAAGQTRLPNLTVTPPSLEAAFLALNRVSEERDTQTISEEEDHS